VRAEARAFADRQCAPRAGGDRRGGGVAEAFPDDVFAAIAAAGLFGSRSRRRRRARARAAGLGATAVTIEELAYHSSSVAAIFDVHCILAGHALEAGGTPTA